VTAIGAWIVPGTGRRLRPSEVPFEPVPIDRLFGEPVPDWRAYDMSERADDAATLDRAAAIVRREARKPQSVTIRTVNRTLRQIAAQLRRAR
jgi:hypothetical protein